MFNQQTTETLGLATAYQREPGHNTQLLSLEALSRLYSPPADAQIVEKEQ